MELKEAMEAATENLDVRPGFLGDVMAGARRRHTRKLIAITAAVALLAGGITGVALTRTSPSEPPVAADVRLTAATTGDLAHNAEFLQQALTMWNGENPTGDLVTEVSGDAHVFWAANTPDGPAALVAQSVRVRNTAEPRTLVGLVRTFGVVDQEIVYREGREEGIYRFGDTEATYVVLGLGQRIFWSASPARGPDLRYSRTWQEAEVHGGVAVVSANPAEKTVFLRTAAAPAADDFTRVNERISPRQEDRQQKIVQPRPGLGWKDVMWASSRREPSRPASSQDKLMSEDLRRRGYLDYDTPFMLWEVRAWLPDGRFAMVIETNGEVLGALYQADGTFDRVLAGGPAVKGSPVPVRLALPDGQGTILADRGALLGPDGHEDAWLAPPGTTEVAVLRAGTTTTVPL